ncbi:MAG: serine hydrolase [Thermotogota bacterium]
MTIAVQSASVHDAAVFDELRVHIEREMTSRGVPGLAVTFVEGDRVLWSEGFGVTDRRTQRPITSETPFSVQSIGKTYTATAFLVVATRGLISLDDRLREVVPEFRVRSRWGDKECDKITFRHLLTHRSGLGHEAPVGNNDDLRPCTFEEHIRSMGKTWLRFPVGERFGYSNLGMDLIAYSIERLTGKAFPDFVREDLLVPLGITTATYDPTEFCAPGHSGAHERRRVPVPMLGAGGLYISASDAARFISFHLRGCTVDGVPVVRPDLLREMTSVQYAAEGQRGGYGLGIAIDSSRALDVLQHGGGGYGYAAVQAWMPEANLGVALAINQEEAYDLGESASLPVLERLAALRGYVRPGAARPPFGGEVAVEVDSNELRRLQGTFLDRGLAYEVREEAGTLLLNGRPLRPCAPRTFATQRGNRITFRVGSDGQPLEIQALGPFVSGEFAVDHTPFDSPGPNKPEWQELVGIYRLAIEDGDLGPQWMPVVLRDGYLCAERGECRMRLHEHAPGLFFTAEGDSAEFENGELLWAGGARLRRESTPPYNRVLALVTADPSHELASWESLTGLASAYRALGEHEMARRLLRACVKIHKPLPGALYGLAQASHSAGDEEYASELCRLVLAAEPEHEAALELLRILSAPNVS